MSALLWRGKPYLLLDAIRQRADLQLISSFVLLEELADVLTRPAATKRLALIAKTPREVIADYRRHRTGRAHRGSARGARRRRR